MIHYHGTPIACADDQVSRIMNGKHAFVSFAHISQLSLVQEVCQTWALDNGAFSFWKSGKETDWSEYYEFIANLKSPNMDFFIIPDVIQGDEEENDRLIQECPNLSCLGVPVFHTSESLDRAERLADQFPLIALGSSEGLHPGADTWWMRINEIMEALCDENGKPKTKIHGLRMLNPDVFKKIPFASADSTSVARNTSNSYRFNGGYKPLSSHVRGQILIDRIESFNAPQFWKKQPIQLSLL